MTDNSFRPAQPQPALIDYTNWRKEQRGREILPIMLAFGTNRWHDRPGWLLQAIDLEANDLKMFAMEGIHGWSTKDRPITVDALLEFLRPQPDVYGGLRTIDEIRRALGAMRAAQGIYGAHPDAKP